MYRKYSQSKVASNKCSYIIIMSIIKYTNYHFCSFCYITWSQSYISSRVNQDVAAMSAVARTSVARAHRNCCAGDVVTSLFIIMSTYHLDRNPHISWRRGSEKKEPATGRRVPIRCWYYKHDWGTCNWSQGGFWRQGDKGCDTKCNDTHHQWRCEGNSWALKVP